MSSTIVVTGAAGFVGSHLCDRLLERGTRILAVDNFSTGSSANVAHHRRNPRFRLLRHDVENPLPVAPSIETVFHLAACASPAHYQRDPIKTTTTNVIGTRSMLELANRQQARFILTSTSEVYGDPSVHPQSEDYHGNVNPIGPRACYDEGKRCAETLTFAYASAERLDVRVARVFNTYGPRMGAGDGRVVSNFVAQALRGQPLTIYGDGTQTRSFCYVDDLVEGLLRLEKSSFAKPVNLGNPGEITMLELAERILTLTSSRSRLEFRPLPVDDPRRRCPAIETARRELGWSPRVGFEDGLRQTIEWFRYALSDRQPQAATCA